MNISNLNEYKKESLLNSKFYKALLEELTDKERKILQELEYEELLDLLKKLVNKKSVQKADYFE